MTTLDRPPVPTRSDELAEGESSGHGPSHGLVPAPWRVLAVHRELATTVTLDLAPSEGVAPPFLPGQINMLAVFGVGEVPISVSSDPRRQQVQGHTIRAAGAVSTALCGMQPGDIVGVRGPYGTHWDVASARGRDVVFVGGGIGMAPLRPAMYAVLAERERYGRIAIVSGSRSPDDILFAEELSSWRRRFDLDVHVTVDRPERGWRGEVGLVTQPLGRLPLDWSSTTAFVCGPDVMMQAVSAALVDLGVDPREVRLTLERNMKCAVGLCGHCQLGPVFVCKDGPVVRYADIAGFYRVKEV